MKRDGRKRYPMGTQASVDIEAQTDEPQTRARGDRFQEIVRDVMLEARKALAQRLADEGYADVTVAVVDMNCSAWFPSDVVRYRDEDSYAAGAVEE